MAHSALASFSRDDDPTVSSFGPWKWVFAAALAVAVFLATSRPGRGVFVWNDDAKVLPRAETPLLAGTLPDLVPCWGPLSRTTPCRSAPSGSNISSGAKPLWAITWSISSSTPRQPCWWRRSSAAWRSRRLSGGGHLRTSSGLRGIGGLDHGIEKHSFRRLLPGRFCSLYVHFDLYAEGASGTWGRSGLFPLGLAEQQTATVMLPAVLPVIFWWQRGRWRVARASSPSNNNTARMAVPRVVLETRPPPLAPFLLCRRFGGRDDRLGPAP